MPITSDKNSQKNKYSKISSQQENKKPKMICKWSCHCPDSVLRYPSLVFILSENLFQEKDLQTTNTIFLDFSSSITKIKQNKSKTKANRKIFIQVLWTFLTTYPRSWLDEKWRCNWTKSNWVRAYKMTFIIYIKIIPIGGHLSNMPNTKTNKLFQYYYMIPNFNSKESREMENIPW